MEQLTGLLQAWIGLIGHAAPEVHAHARALAADPRTARSWPAIRPLRHHLVREAAREVALEEARLERLSAGGE